ncbi:ankyrin repeat domain-containing protein SOWAHC [Heptranchias perlo]|uniref:ankyrin repeat domain-containing protein SOWAHC n=1 Tax=Heptranchias perlo TaxID=212740 RepID=UPI00355AB4E1
MFEKVGEMSHSRFLAAAGPGAPYRPVGDALPASERDRSLTPSPGCKPLSYGEVLGDVNRLSHLLGRFLETAEISERLEAGRPATVGTSPRAGRGEGGVGRRWTSSGRSRDAGGRSAVRKRESLRGDGGESAPDPASDPSPNTRKKCLKELMIGNGWDGFSGMWSALGTRKTDSAGEPEPEEEEAAAASLPSAGTDESSGPPGCAALDPGEHAWMLAVAGGDWEKMASLLLSDPGLLNKKDFVTGLTAAHWLAKQGKDETLARLVDLAQRRGWPVDINARASGGGYTALHLAAMQGHQMVIKLLVGAYSADVDARDYGGRKAWQYLGGNVPSQLRQLAGAQEEQQETQAVPEGEDKRRRGRRTVRHPQRQAGLPAADDQVDGPAKLSRVASLHRLFKLSYWWRRRSEEVDRTLKLH